MTDINHIEIDKQDKPNNFCSNSQSIKNINTQININTNLNNFRSTKSFNNPPYQHDNNFIDINANNLVNEMKENPNYNPNLNNYEYEDPYQGEANNFVQNLSEYNQSNYGSIRKKNIANNNNIYGAGNQFAKTIVQLDDEENKKKNPQYNFPVDPPKDINRNRINLNVKSNNLHDNISL